MRHWFLSYHSPDQALAERLKTAIESKDGESSVFFAPTHLRAGGSWSAQLAQKIAEANAFLFLIGESGIGKWQVPEYYEAYDRHVNSPTEFPLIVVLLEGQTAPGLPFIRQMHWIVSADPVSEISVARIFDATSGHGDSPSEMWRYTSPYRGLAAMEEKDSDYFFGRTRETAEVLNALASPHRIPVLIGNSGVGKSSLAQAGVIAALKRQAWPEQASASNAWPAVFQNSRQWCYLSLKPGADPLKSLVEAFLDTWQFAATDFERIKQQNGLIDLLLDGKATLSDLIDATERRYDELDQRRPPGFFLYVDQGEELYIRAEERQRLRFSELIAQAMSDPRLRMMMSMRSDFLGDLQADKPLFKARLQIDVPPLGEEELREVISRPAQLLGVKFENERLVDIITRRTAEDSVKDIGALPLLSYTLDDMWTRMQLAPASDGILRLPMESFELGGVLVERATRFLAEHPGEEGALRNILTLRCAAVREDGEPTRRRAARAEFSDQEWSLVSELADHPNRLLVTVSTSAGQTYTEVAHEAIFRRWTKLREWIVAEREFLAWRNGLEAARRAWEATPEGSKRDALLMGAALSQAQSWYAEREHDLLGPDRDFIVSSIAREQKARTSARHVRALIYTLLIGIIVGLFGWINQSSIKHQWRWYVVERPFAAANILPFVLKSDAEKALKAGNTFRECALGPGKDYCPEMVVVPAGSFLMGSPPSEKGRSDQEGPQHRVNIAKPFAVSKFDVTFDEWDTCVAHGECPDDVRDAGWGRGQQPLVNVTWDDAKLYVTWLSKMTGKPYRLLSEAEYEYAARAGAQTAYPWGDEVGRGNASCNGCGSKWDNLRPAPVGSFAANRFGLYDMVGNILAWVDDCYHPNYEGSPPVDGTPWITGDCSRRVDRGGHWYDLPEFIRSAARDKGTPDRRGFDLGIRVGRTLDLPPQNH